MLLSYGPFFFDFNYPTPWRGWDSKDCFPTGPFFFTLNYPSPGEDNRKKEPPGGGSFLHFPVDTGADIRYRYR